MAQQISNLPCNSKDAGDVDSIHESGRSLGGVNGNPRQYACLKNPMDKGAWQSIVHSIAMSGTRMSEHTHTIKPDFGVKCPRSLK